MTRMTTTDRLREANAEAQALFHAMLDANAYGDPDAPETRRYVEAERHVDTILEYAQWERAKAQLDALTAADLAAGDHFVYNAPVGR